MPCTVCELAIHVYRVDVAPLAYAGRHQIAAA
jgi:hypothetical protein